MEVDNRRRSLIIRIEEASGFSADVLFTDGL